MDRFKRIVLNIPHSSDVLPCKEAWQGDIDREVEKWTDTLTDVLFAPNDLEVVPGGFRRIKPVVFPYSRFFCDAERLLDDPLEEIGQGICYTSFNGCTREVNHALRSYCMQEWWKHQEKLAAVMCERCLLLDCHSFPTEVAPDIDVCIGFNQDWSQPDLSLVEHVCKFFEDNSLTVALNKPYANSITPHRDYFYNSLMIEINKSVYLNDDGEKRGSMYKVNQMLNYLYRELLE